MDTDDPSDMNFAQSEDLRIDNERPEGLKGREQ